MLAIYIIDYHIRRGYVKVMNNSIENIKRSKQTILEIIITTVIISIGINFVVLGISNELGLNNNLALIIVGSIMIILSLLITFFQNFKKSNRNLIIEAALVYDNENRKILDIDGYKFSNDICRYLNAALSEDKNIEAMWLKDRLAMTHIFNEIDPDKTFVGVSRSGALLNQLIEYIVLKKLSTLTTDYFNFPKCDKAKIVRVQRDEISDFVTSNVFMDLFSKPPYERVAFDNKEFERNVVLSFGKNGAIYDKFELYIPLKCQFIKENHNTIVLKHRYFKLEIVPAFTGFGTVLPHDFEKKYMKVEDVANISSYKIMIGINLKFSPLAFFMKKEQYYGWVDEFANELTNYASIDKFFEDIRWDIVRTFMKCNK